VVRVADGGVQLRQVVALRLDAFRDRLDCRDDGDPVVVRHAPVSVRFVPAHWIRESAGVSAGAPSSSFSSSSTAQTVIDAPAISSEVM